MNKIATSIEQSKKLIELGIDVNTADMGWYYNPELRAARNQMWLGTKAEGVDIPAWSLTALLNIAPKYFSKKNHQFMQSYSYDHIDGCYHFIYRDYQHGGRSKYISKNKDLFAAAFEMICWLIENKKI